MFPQFNKSARIYFSHVFDSWKQHRSGQVIARPTNNVRVIVAEASGCCAREVRAVAKARPSPRAGHIQPMPVVMPAVAIDTTATTVTLSIRDPLWSMLFALEAEPVAH